MTSIKTNKKTGQETTVIRISGLIQGIGFRPYIYRLAKNNNLRGEVFNQNKGVTVFIQGTPENIKTFISKIQTEAPPVAHITGIDTEKTRMNEFPDFTISKSLSTGNQITQVSPDIAVCSECLKDMSTQKHRINYPFINCTNCGPRFSIIRNIPYDRPYTSMNVFEMCPVCRTEYENINDRRFHAQPVACNNCGPSYSLHINNMQTHNFEQILQTIISLIDNDGVIAIKGLGGYNLMCNAFSKPALVKLRKIKERDGKPFAIMFDSVVSAKKYASLDTEEIRLLDSWQRPIVLSQAVDADFFPFELANGLSTLGIFLPNIPLHFQIFKGIKTRALVMTSGNISDCPIIISDDEAVNTFKFKTDCMVSNNREIINRVDDSVVQKDAMGIQIIRRARGYTPKPVLVNFNVEGIFATGPELSNTFCIGKGRQAILSQHIGDLKNLETLTFYEHSYDTMKRLFRFEPELLACDMHPDYLSTQFAQKLELPVIYTQHHHAHIASVMAEYGIDEPVIGIAFDGTGYGTDGKIWGSEIMVATYTDFERKNHFEYIPLPGGDKVSKEPWRIALAYLFHTYGDDFPQDLPFLKKLKPETLELSKIALRKNINTPETCSAGRLFDAVSALTNLCVHSSYHAEAPVRLEQSVDETISAGYPIELDDTICWNSTIKGIVQDVQNKRNPGEIAATFHNTVAYITVEAIKKIHENTGIKKVVLSGGSFQNRYVLKKILDLSCKTRLQFYISRQVPVNDGGLALGQMAIAANKKRI